MKKKKVATSTTSEVIGGGSKVKKPLKFNYLDEEAEEVASDSDISEGPEED